MNQEENYDENEPNIRSRFRKRRKKRLVLRKLLFNRFILIVIFKILFIITVKLCENASVANRLPSRFLMVFREKKFFLDYPH